MRLFYRSALAALLASLSFSSIATADAVRLSVSMTGVGASLQMTPQGELMGCDVNFCRYRYERGQTVEVVAQPGRRGAFKKWLSACSGSTPMCSVRLDQNRTLYARFSPVALATGVLSPREGTVQFAPPPLSGTCGRGCQLFDYGTRVRITAQPAEFRAFERWEGDCAGVAASVCGLTMFKDATAFPRFRCTGSGEDCVSSQSDPLERVVKIALTARGVGSLLVSGSQCDGTTCRTVTSTVQGQTKTFSFQRKTMVTLKARSGRASWSGGTCRRTSAMCQLTALRDAFGALPKVTASLTS